MMKSIGNSKMMIELLKLGKLNSTKVQTYEHTHQVYYKSNCYLTLKPQIWIAISDYESKSVSLNWKTKKKTDLVGRIW